MNPHKQLILDAPVSAKGGDLYRCRAAFRGLTQDQMSERYDHSGQTRAELLAGYEAHDAKVAAAIAWVKEQL